MSGIFGYIGKEDCKKTLIDGLTALKSRGCEMTGMAIKSGEDLLAIKANGGTVLLEERAKTELVANIGLAQTDIAMRAKASQITAKPACNNLYAVCMDGEIADFDALKRWCRNPFPIATDEELIMALLCVMEERDSVALLKRLVLTMRNPPTLAFFSNHDDAIFCYRGVMPLIIGIGNDECFISSEVNALVGHAQRYIALQPGDCARITGERVSIFDTKSKKIKRTISRMPPFSCIEDDYLYDGISYCPTVIKECYHSFVTDAKINFDYLKLTKHYISHLQRIYVIGEGASLSVALCGGSNLALMTDIPVYALQSDELIWADRTVNDATLVLCISYSGEDCGSVMALLRCKRNKARVISVTDNPYSEIARLSDSIIRPQHGFETANAVNSFFADYFALCLLSIYIGRKSEIVSDTYYNVMLKMAELLPGKVLSAIKAYPEYKSLTDLLLSRNNVIFTGYRYDYALALEGAKMAHRLTDADIISAELSTLQDFYSSKLASGCTVLCVITSNSMMPHALKYLRRLKILGAKVIIYTTSNLEQEMTDFNCVITFNDSVQPLNPIPCVAGLYNAAITAAENQEPGTDIAV